MTAQVVLTFRADASGLRLANLTAVLRWLAQFPDLPVLVVEQDSVARLTQPLPHPLCTVLFARNPGRFNRAWGLNVGARQTSASPVIVFGDADVIVPGDSLAAAVRHCAQRYQVVKPYRNVIDLSADASEGVRQRGLSAAPQAQATLVNGQGDDDAVALLCEDVFVIRADAFWSLGGWDERFAGAGAELGLTYKIQRARRTALQWPDAAALRLWRPAAAPGNETDDDDAHEAALLERYRRYTDPELQRLAEVQGQIAGRREKYHPTSTQS